MLPIELIINPNETDVKHATIITNTLSLAVYGEISP